MKKLVSREPLYKALGDKLLSVVGEKRQSEIAQELYASQPAVCNWLNGKSRPEPWRLGHLAALFDLPPDELANLAGYDCEPDAYEKLDKAFQDRVRLLSTQRAAE